MRRQNSVLTPALYTAIDATPGPAADTAERPALPGQRRQRHAAPRCKAANYAEQAGNDDHFSPYWRARNLITGAKGSPVPLFLTQGTDGEQHRGRRPRAVHRATTRATSARGSGRGTTSAAPRPMARAACSWAAPAGTTRSCASTGASSRASAATDDAGSTDRGPVERGDLARRAGVAARRPDRLHDRAEARHVHRRRHRRAARAPAPPRASGPSRAAAARRASRGARTSTIDVAGPPRSNLVVDVYDLDANGRRAAASPARAT